MKRILQLIETKGPGGAETVFLSLLEGLDRTRWDVLPVITGPGWLKSRVEELGFKPLELESSGSYDLKFLKGIRDVLRDESFDLIHAHLQGGVVYGALASQWARVPMVGTFHGFPDLDLAGVKGWMKRQILLRSNACIVCVSESLRRDAIAAGITTPNRSRAISNGIDLRRFRPVQDTRGEGQVTGSPHFRVGAVGNVRPAKDYGNLMRAAALVECARPGRFRFMIYGQKTEPLYSNLLDLRSELALTEDHVSFEGFQDDIPGALSQLDCLVISSSSEGFSLAAVQAMASGVPVVATRCGGPEEIIDDGLNGLLVPPGDPRSLADAIIRLAGSPERRSDLVRAGQEKVASRFSLEAMISSYEAVYREALGKPTAGPSMEGVK